MLTPGPCWRKIILSLSLSPSSLIITQSPYHVFPLLSYIVPSKCNSPIMQFQSLSLLIPLYVVSLLCSFFIILYPHHVASSAYGPFIMQSPHYVIPHHIVLSSFSPLIILSPHHVVPYNFIPSPCSLFTIQSSHDIVSLPYSSLLNPHVVLS